MVIGCDDCEVVASLPPLVMDEKNKNSAEGERTHVAHPSLTFLLFVSSRLLFVLHRRSQPDPQIGARYTSASAKKNDKKFTDSTL